MTSWDLKINPDSVDNLTPGNIFAGVSLQVFFQHHILEYYLNLMDSFVKTYYLNEISKVAKTCYSNKRQIRAVILARNYINDNIEQGLNLELLSRVGFSSKFHFLRIFKRHYGQTPNQYLTGKRIERAKELLALGNNISETCYTIGFQSPCSFSTLFKSRLGMTPTEFQKRAIFAKPI